VLGLSRARQIVATKTKRRRTRWRQRQGELKKYSKGWMVHIQSSTCRAWTKHFANLSKNLVQTNVGINQWWWRKGISFGDLIGEQFSGPNSTSGLEMLCFKLFITCRLGMMVKEEFCLTRWGWTCAHTVQCWVMRSFQGKVGWIWCNAMASTSQFIICRR